MMNSVKTLSATAVVLALSGYALAQDTPRDGGAVDSSRGAVTSAPSAVNRAPSAVNRAPSAVNSAPNGTTDVDGATSKH